MMRIIRSLALAASISVLQACDSGTGPDPASMLIANGGDGQSSAAGTGAAAAVSVRVTTSKGKPVAGVTVQFVVASGGGSVASAAVVTNSTGVAETAWILGTRAGANTLTVTSSGLTGSPLTFTANGMAGPAASVSKTAGHLQTGIAGAPLNVRPSVTVSDAHGNAVAGATVRFDVTQGGGTVSGASQVSNADGTAAVQEWTLGTVMGPNALTASVTGTNLFDVFQATALAGAPATVSVNAGDSQVAITGSAVATAPSVIVRDRFQNAVAGAAVVFTTPSGGVVTNGSSTTNANGIAGVGSWTLGAPGPNTLVAAVSASGVAGNPLSFSATALSTDALPTIAVVSPATLVPGANAVISGSNFDTDAARNAVSIGGVPATVISATSTQIVAAVPCIASGDVAVRVFRSGIASAPVNRPLAAPQLNLAIGAAVVRTTNAASACNELVSAGSGNARYLVAVFSSATSQNTLVDFRLAGNRAPGVSANVITPSSALTTARTALRGPESERDAEHFRHLERERALYESTRSRGEPMASVIVRDPIPAINDMRDLFYTYEGCSNTTQIVRGRAIYVGSRAIIWEDSANVVQSSANPILAGYYQRLGQIFDIDQYDVIRNTFGDPLRRDLDGDGRVHMVFSQRVNTSGPAAFVTSCDQLPPTPTRGSNFGEFFYGSVPTNSTSNLNSTSAPDGWFNFMARTVVHEVKHIASYAARYANSAPVFEQSWLEEGTARHAEEVWVRGMLHRVAWKANTGFGTAASNGIYCDFHPADATCNANDPLRRPSYGVRRQFNEIREKLFQPWNWSPFGDATGQTGSVFYQTSWSLVRYTIDRYGASDAAFLTALNNSTTNGITNLTTVSGASIDQLLGGWGLALFADDYPGTAALSADASFPTWNLRDIYAGLNASPAWRATYPNAFPIAPTQLAFGSFDTSLSALRGGAHAFYEINGPMNASQILRLLDPLGGAPSPNLRIAVVRLQ